jgi:HAMP domain-containing protein
MGADGGDTRHGARRGRPSGTSHRTREHRRTARDRLLGRSLTAAIASFASLRATLAALVLAGLVVSFAGSVLIAANITRPLSELATAAGRIEHGDYGAEVGVQRADVGTC